MTHGFVSFGGPKAFSPPNEHPDQHNHRLSYNQDNSDPCCLRLPTRSTPLTVPWQKLQGWHPENRWVSFWDVPYPTTKIQAENGQKWVNIWYHPRFLSLPWIVGPWWGLLRGERICWDPGVVHQPPQAMERNGGGDWWRGRTAWDGKKHSRALPLLCFSIDAGVFWGGELGG